MEIIASGPASETVAEAADGDDDGDGIIDMDAMGGREGSGSWGSSGPVPGV